MTLVRTHKAAPIDKIYANPNLLAQYNDLVTEIRSLDSGVPIPPPVHISSLDYMRGLLASLEGNAA